jgi:hypothetical protein
MTKTQILANWNEKWKVQRLPMVVALPSHVVSFFENTKIIDASETRIPILHDDGEYSDEDEYLTEVTFKKENGEEFEVRLLDYYVAIGNQAMRDRFDLSSADERVLEELLRAQNFDVLTDELSKINSRPSFSGFFYR